MPEPLRVYLEFEASGDPITGTVTSGNERRPFTGWLGLIAGLENAVGGWQRHWGPGPAAASAESAAEGEKRTT
jgi:hypothetical protein